ncbi:unnamed protein product [Pieris macdunnoughi]|uniref:Nuclear pore complex protein Nup85 n=1 Tax=Pieris macdunnoughi TaxID=345717 RepID=A0A821Y214_9NEOP|nr:unnamed protein product [Pieris macdunnoughi]
MNFTRCSDANPNSHTIYSKKRVKQFNLPHKCFERNVACVWRRGNKIAIFPGSQTTIKTIENCDNKILDIRQEISLFTPILRKLVNEANGAFLSLQKASDMSKSSDNQVEYLKLSRQYRSIVRVCLENLQEATEKASDGLERNSLQSFTTIFYSIECIWHLCEILYIDVIPGEIVLPYILEWARFHFPCHEQTAASILEACEKGSEDNPEYWNTIIGMVVQGRIDVARALLKLHSSSDSSEFKLLDNSMRAMPVYNVYGGISSGEFTISWKHWHAECRSKYTSGSLARQPQLELILRIMIGDYTAFETIRIKYTSWFDMLGGWILFTMPWAKRRELASAAAACAGLTPGEKTHLDIIIQALLEGDLHQVIHEIQQVSDNGWSATHLTDMLYHCGKLQILDKQIDVTAKIRDSLILEYGTLLMEHKSLWSAGLSYLAATPPEGLKRAELLLERIPIDSEAKAMRILAEANKYGLPNVVQTVCGCMSTRRLKSGNSGAALAWGGRTRSTELCARAAEQALRRYCAGAPLPHAELLLTGSTVLLSKYCDFHILYKNREFRKAAKLLVSLITSKLSPDFFWETLLLDTLPLLETETPVLSADETYEIMLCLELHSCALTGKKADMLRFALARNLERTALLNLPDED